MQFFQSFYSLGYSGIVLLLSALFVGALLFNTLKMHRFGWLPKILFVIVLATGFVFSTNYLAKERALMMEAIKAEGGLKRTETK